MTVKIIGAGVGRTGTYSLKLALNQLGFGPCHHMEEVLFNLPSQVPLWSAAVEGRADWDAIYQGYSSAVDWPTAGFFRELHAAYPEAKVILTLRSPDTWAASFSETIYKLLGKKEDAPEEMRAWLDMAAKVIEKTGFPSGLDLEGLKKAFLAHEEAVRAAIPERQLLVFQVKDGWAPLCEFLESPVPSEAFPRTNDRGEFWDRVAGVK
ncbi:MAG: sulfotransferase [Limibacillus sp.]